jgi:hypothetical protein
VFFAKIPSWNIKIAVFDPFFRVKHEEISPKSPQKTPIFRVFFHLFFAIFSINLGDFSANFSVSDIKIFAEIFCHEMKKNKKLFVKIFLVTHTSE